ncbi:MAG: hypothetical protein K0Q90_3000 [Paenibacillaceae bacterium]|nr:hypothetical protein [Paenibacillaceae bacterium]
MELRVLNARMELTEADGYVGKVAFEVEGHMEPYEIVLQSKKGKEWSYGLFFLNQPGDEDQILDVEDWLEEDDDAYNGLIEAAKKTLPSGG